MLSRRSFLKWAGSAAAATVAVKALPALELDPEKALWVPGKKTIFIPETESKLISGIEALQANVAEVRRNLNPAFYAQDARLGNTIRMSRYMINEKGLVVPVTPEGYRAGYQIYEVLDRVIDPNLSIEALAQNGATWNMIGQRHNYDLGRQQSRKR